MKNEAQPTVLVVEDERELADLYHTWLKEAYSVRTAYNGEEALTELNDELDVVLLDRRMPDISGDEILEQIREESLNCRVAMVTAVEPDVNIVDMGFDDYLLKPISKADLNSTVEWLTSLTSYDELLQEYYTLASKIGVLEMTREPDELDSSDDYVEARARLEELQSREQEQLNALYDDGRSEAVMSRIVNHWNRQATDSTD